MMLGVIVQYIIERSDLIHTIVSRLLLLQFIIIEEFLPKNFYKLKHKLAVIIIEGVGWSLAINSIPPIIKRWI